MKFKYDSPDIWGLNTINGTAGGRKSPGSPLVFVIKRTKSKVNIPCMFGKSRRWYDI